MRRLTLLVTSLLVLTGCGARTSPPSTGAPTRTPDHSRVVPWLPLPPTRPVIDSVVIPRRPDPGRAQQSRRCHGSDVDLHWRGAGGAAGTMIENVVVGLVPGHAPCAVSGRPTLAARTIEGRLVPGTLSMWTVRTRGPVLLTRRQHALVQLTWPSACTSFRTTDLGRGGSITLGYAGSTWTHPVPDLSHTCHLGPDRPLRGIGVSRFVPLHLRPARRTTAYDSVRVHGPGQLVARPGQPIDFVVTLVARHDLVLAPCPDYELGASPGSGRTYALNCAAVPWQDAGGTPYLPAGRSVRFAMHLSGMDGTVQKFWWGIVAPGSPPYLGGVVEIR